MSNVTINPIIEILLLKTNFVGHIYEVTQTFLHRYHRRTRHHLNYLRPIRYSSVIDLTTAPYLTIDNTILIIFTVDYFVRLWFATDNAAF